MSARQNARRVGMIGAGLMGTGVAANLVRAGHRVHVCAHRRRENVERLLAMGAVECDGPADIAARAEIIFVCVTDSDCVKAVVETMRPALRRGTMIVDLGTSLPEANETLAQDLRRVGVGFMESPLTGGPDQAEDGRLGALVGAGEEDLARVRPLLETFCARISHMGPVGAGQRAKLINNYLVCGMIALIGESFTAARTAGIDWRALYETMKCGSNYSPALARMVEPALAGDFDGYRFSMANAAKDMGYYLQLAATLGVDRDLARAAHRRFAEAVAAGRGEEFVSRLLEEHGQ